MNRFKNKSCFTLAEMMVVMLILTIVLAAFAPLMTKRKTVDLSSPWRYATNNSDIYYGLGAKQSAMIGQNSKASGDLDSRLIINTSDDSQAHILLKSSKGSPYGMLYAYRDNLLLGGSGITMPSFPTYNQSGLGNTSVGINAMYKIAGSANTAIGNEALMNSSSGIGNTAVGTGALKNTSKDYNTAVGYGAGDNISGSFNVAAGYNALNAGADSYNIAIGYGACRYVTGSNKICIGNKSGPPKDYEHAKDGFEHIYIGSQAKSNPERSSPLEIHNTPQDPTVVINGNLVVNGVIYGNSEILAGYRLYADGRSPNGTFRHTSEDGDDTRNLTNFPWIKTYSDRWSDKRLKDIKGESKAGLDQIRQLKVYDYTFKKDKENKSQVGVIAQDLQKVFPEAVREGLGGYLMIRQDDMFYAMINSIKQLDTFVQGILNEIKVVLEKITGVDNRVKVLEQENKQLKEQIQEMNKRLEKIEKSSL